MSVNDQITRIRNNVTNSLSAVQEKGVSVPAGANSDNLPGLIAQISGGEPEVEEITNEAGGKSVYINSEMPKLPEGYTRLKWIQSTGTQYINTEYTPNSNTRVLLDAYNLSADSKWIFGAWTSKSSLQFASSCDGAYSFRYGSTSASLSSVPVGSLNVDFNKNAYNMNGTMGAMREQTFTCEYPLFLFRINAKGTASSGKFTGQVSSCRIWDNGVLVRDYVPCLNAENVAGLYDFANGVFYGDAAGGAFMAGPVVLEYELPEGYTQVEYVQTNGDNWLDTGIYPSGTTRIVVDADLIGGDTYPTLFGAWTDGNSGKYILLALSNASIRSYYGTTETDANVSIYGRHVVEQNKGDAYVDGVQYVSKADSSFATSQTLYLGTFHGSETSGSFGAIAKYYSAQIYQGSTLVRNFVPCTNASGVGGMYDTVNGVFYTAKGSGAFEVGVAVTVGVSKVVLEDQVLIDLTGDTISPETVLAGIVGHDKTGAQFVGELVQKAGGRPFASGIYTPTSDVYTMTISGLSFDPKIVLMLYVGGSSSTSLGPIGNSGSVYTILYYYDSEQNKFTWIGKENNSEPVAYRTNGVPYYNPSGKAAQKITLNSDGFTAGQYYNGGYYFESGSDYYWYAIGAES